MDLKGLRANVYYNARYRGCANGGISERVEAVTVVGIVDHRWPAPLDQRIVKPLPREAQASAPTDDAPAVVLVYRNIGDRQLVHAEPVEPAGENVIGYMDGGSFVASTDGRLSELTGFYGAVSLHDRCETPAVYAALTAGD